MRSYPFSSNQSILYNASYVHVNHCPHYSTGFTRVGHIALTLSLLFLNCMHGHTPIVDDVIQADTKSKKNTWGGGDVCVG